MPTDTYLRAKSPTKVYLQADLASYVLETLYVGQSVLLRGQTTGWYYIVDPARLTLRGYIPTNANVEQVLVPYGNTGGAYTPEEPKAKTGIPWVTWLVVGGILGVAIILLRPRK